MIGTVNEGDVYLLNFSAISNSNTAKLNINFTNTTGTSPKSYKLSTTRKEYSIPVTFNDNGGGSGQYLYFTLHNKGARVWLDNISIQKVTVNQTADASVVRFEVNETDAAKQVNLGTSTYKDVFGNVYTGTITLEPYTSKILVKYDSTQVVTETDNNAKQHLKVYPCPNPGNKSLNIIVRSQDETSTKMRIFSINGCEVLNRDFALSAGENRFTINTLPKGMYFIESLTASGNRDVTKFVQ